MLGRVARRRQAEQAAAAAADDREKTLEPDRPYMNPVTRSATTVLMGDKAYQAYQKERTPYKLGASRSRTKLDGAGATKELSLLQDNNRHKLRGDDPIMRKDTLYEAYNKSAARFNGTSALRNGTSTDHGQRSRGVGREYYESSAGKENLFKSKYDPDNLYAEINNNNNNEPANDEAEQRKRAIRSYKRTCTANDRRHTTAYKDLQDEDTPSSSAASRYQQRKSYQRSQTQKFFDAEDAAASSSSYKPSLARTEASVYTEQPAALSEREARRKEIQGLIMKYAQLDDVYSKVNDKQMDQVNNNGTINGGGMYGGALQMSATSTALAFGQQQQRQQSHLMPLSKTQSVASMSVRSRIPKTLSTFVRENIYFWFFAFITNIRIFLLILSSYVFWKTITKIYVKLIKNHRFSIKIMPKLVSEKVFKFNFD